MAKVCIIRCDGYNRDKVRQAVSEMFREFGAKSFFHPGEKILLKPNLLASRTPDMAVTTHPAVFDAVAQTMREYETILFYGDSPAADSPAKAQQVCGIEEAAKEQSVLQADFISSVRRDFPEGKIARRFQLVRAVEDTDGIVSICKFKTHALTRFTGALKNQFGLIPGTLKAKCHVQYPTEDAFTQMLADLNSCVRPRLFVMDAIVGMEGNGPSNGTPRALGMLMLSDDPVALDSVCVGIAGLDYRMVPLVRNGERSGVGIADPDKIELCLIEDQDGKRTIRREKASFLLPGLVAADFVNAVRETSAIGLLNRFFGMPMRRWVLNRPCVIPEKCTKCRLCVRTCPAQPKAIGFSEKKHKIVYRYGRCIRCFCCQELCPSAAIEVRKGPLSLF